MKKYENPASRIICLSFIFRLFIIINYFDQYFNSNYEEKEEEIKYISKKI